MSTVQLPVIPKPKREDVPKDKVLCEFCTAKCCRYFALPIDLPETIDEWEFVRWYLLHDAASVFQYEGSWYHPRWSGSCLPKCHPDLRKTNRPAHNAPHVRPDSSWCRSKAQSRGQ